MSKSEEQRARNRERRGKTCRHFTGIINEVCELGINYDTVTSFPASRADHPPFMQTARACFGRDDEECSIVCPKREFYTKDELDEQERQQYERLNQYFEDLKNDICPNHKIPITKKQIGRCIYADPCGCRLGQGKLKKN